MSLHRCDNLFNYLLIITIRLFFFSFLVIVLAHLHLFQIETNSKKINENILQ